MWSRKIQQALVGVAIFGLIASCSSKKKENMVDSDLEGGISEKPLYEDSMGSDGGNIPGLSSINFGYDQVDITPQMAEVLNRNGDFFRNNPSLNVQIEGHCDDRGSLEYNLTLGERRAKVVKNYLVGLGIPETQLSTISYGEEKPLREGDTEADRASNRRANFRPMR